eukprot:CAMPEP_0184699208 /NCGR_PEP_ID=MMETSP0313-20130426/5562_1 /TAXON_ID=2792 /ORGANISM="Porphyridium aerugineum, Strain SAG 1380-2" /LENGTH=57 /DNA_ID=CAMNT_0027158261 /DNA_START=104 /DNA_END=274 /DNA_ORIENTATION=-
MAALVSYQPNKVKHALGIICTIKVFQNHHIQTVEIVVVVTWVDEQRGDLAMRELERV